MYKYGDPTIQNTQYYQSRNTTYRQIDNITVDITPDQLLSSIIDNNLLASALGNDIETNRIQTQETDTNILNVNDIKGSDPESIIRILNRTHITEKVLFANINQTFLTNTGKYYYRIHIKGDKATDPSGNRADILIENKYTNIDTERFRLINTNNYENFSKNLNFSSNIIKFNTRRLDFLENFENNQNIFNQNVLGIFARKSDAFNEGNEDLGIFISPKFNLTIGKDISNNDIYFYTINTNPDDRMGNNSFTRRPSVKFVNLNFSYNNDINTVISGEPNSEAVKNFILSISNKSYSNNLYLPIEVDRINIHSGIIINPNTNVDFRIKVVDSNNTNNYFDFLFFEYSSKNLNLINNIFRINNTNGDNILTINNVSNTVSFNNINDFTIDANNLIIKDPIIKIANNNNSLIDKGIEFNYNPSSLGFIGFSNINKKYKILTDAVNNSNIVSGTFAELELGQITNPVSDLSINSTNGNITLNPANTKDVIINSDLDLAGNFLKNGGINVSNIKSDTNIILDPSNTLIIDGNLEVSGNALINYKFNVLGDSSFNSNVEISGNTLIKSTLNVNNNLNLSGSLIVDSSSNFKSNLNISGSLIVDSSSNFNSNLNVSGNLIVEDNTIIKSNLDVYENINAFGDLIIDGSVTFKSTLTFQSDASFNKNIEVSGNIIGRSRLDILNDASFNKNIEVSGNIIGKSRLDIYGDASFNNNIEVSGNIIGKSRLDIYGDASFNNNIEVSGNIIGKSRLDIFNDASFNKDVEISGNIIGKSRLDIYGDVSFNNNIEVSGNIIGKSRLDIYGDASFNKDVEISGNLIVKGNIGFSNLNIAGDLDLADNSIINVSGIFFSDGTYIGEGNSFDICSNQTLKLKGVMDNSGIGILTYNRIYQEINNNDNYNGFYGLSKNTYPKISDAYSEKITSSWNFYNIANNWRSVAWSPDLRIFLKVSTDGSNRIRKSVDGINWTNVANNNLSWQSVCYSNKLKLFAGIANANTNGLFFYNNIAISYINVNRASNNDLNRTSIIWVEELEMFVITCRTRDNESRTNRIILIKSPYTSATHVNPNNLNNWTSITWSPELKLLVAVADSVNNNRVMISSNGENGNWTSINPNSNNEWSSITWASDLGLFVAVAKSGDNNRVMVSSNGINWTLVNPNSNNGWTSVIWSNELKLLIAIANSADSIDNNLIMISKDGYNWNLINPNAFYPWNNIIWSPELSIFLAVGNNYTLISSLKNRIPTNYNIFDSSFNNIDNSGNWIFKAKELYNDTKITLNSNVDICGNLNVSNLNITINNINNNLEISGNLLVINRLDIYGDVSFNKNLDISGDLLIKNKLNVNGDSSLNNLDVSGDLLVLNRLDIYGDSSLNNLDVSGDLLVLNRLDIYGDSSLNNLDVSGDLLVLNRLDIYGDSSLNNLDVSGDLLVLNRLDIYGDASLNNLDVSGDLLVLNRLDIYGDSSLNNLDVSGDLLVLNRLDVMGDASFNNNVDISGVLTVDTMTYPSDLRLKTNIENINGGLDKINNLRGVIYNFKTNLDKKRLGFIAQEVEEILPELVIDRNDYKSINYVEIIPVLVEAIKELKKENDNLKSSMNLILDRLDKLENN